VGRRRACGLACLNRSTLYYKHRGRDWRALLLRMKELALARPRYGYRRLQILLRREGFHANHKVVHRLYQQEGLGLRTKRRRKHVARTRVPLPMPSRPNERWSIDFVSDALADGSRFRALTVIDNYSRECLAIEVARSLPSHAVIAVLSRIVTERGKPLAITLDNGTEFTSNVFDAWAYEQRIALDFIQPGKPVQNAFVESFNGSFRDECLNAHWFTSLDDARTVIAAWRDDYNSQRPHSALDDLAPMQYVQRLMAWSGQHLM
jgi:putative transposase